jgi:hypothetical protein
MTDPTTMTDQARAARTTFVRPADPDDTVALLAETRAAMLEDSRIVDVLCLFGSRLAVRGDRESGHDFARRCWRSVLPFDGDVRHAFRADFGWTDAETIVVAGVLVACAVDLRKQAKATLPGWAATAALLDRDADTLLALRDRWITLHEEN